jgi:hypothetical protein
MKIAEAVHTRVHTYRCGEHLSLRNSGDSEKLSRWVYRYRVADAPATTNRRVFSVHLRPKRPVVQEVVV